MGLFDRGRGYWPLDDDGAPPIGAPPPVIPAQSCDRCRFPASHRVGKVMMVITDTARDDRAPDFGVEVRELDLLFCRGHHEAHVRQLRVQGFGPLPLELAR